MLNNFEMLSRNILTLLKKINHADKVCVIIKMFFIKKTNLKYLYRIFAVFYNIDKVFLL